MKEYQHLIGKIIIAIAIIVAAIIIAGAIEGAGANIQSGLWKFCLLYTSIPYGKLTIIQGDPGDGKTTMVLNLAAKLSKGEALDKNMKVTEPVNVKMCIRDSHRSWYCCNW